MASPLTAAKQQLRRFMKQKLSSVSHEAIVAQSHKVLEALKNLEPYRDAHRLSIYLAMPSGEIQTDAIVRHALAAGKQVFIPYIHKSPLHLPDTPTRVIDMVHLKSMHDYESLKRDAWGIPSIDPATVKNRQRILGDSDVGETGESTLDLMLMPGVAFDRDEAGSIRRLGHGKGFYDFFINRYISWEASKDGNEDPILLYGLALTEQLLPASSSQHIPIGAFDRTLHGLILGDGRMIESSGRMKDK